MKTKCCHTRQFHTVEQSTICLNETCEGYLSLTSCYKEYTKLRKIVASLVFIFSLLFTFNDFSKANKGTEESINWISYTQNLPVSLENIDAELIRLDVICRKEVLAQIKIESAHLSSYLLKRTNNMLGMRYPWQRPTTACGIYIPAMDTIIMGNRDSLRKFIKTDNYAVYNTWQDAIADYKLWQESNFKVTDKYLEFLGRVYAEDSLYVLKIKSITKRMN